ncbi:MAG: hypothetical protein L0271_10175 [Gemmatimonadetes bacterium]|nr:hypothetical protein [Gemmatimonadota bacterium]
MHYTLDGVKKGEDVCDTRSFVNRIFFRFTMGKGAMVKFDGDDGGDDQAPADVDGLRLEFDKATGTIRSASWLKPGATAGKAITGATGKTVDLILPPGEGGQITEARWSATNGLIVPMPEEVPKVNDAHVFFIGAGSG